MASFHNITNENSSVFEEAAYDPDLEARLYAEIYYSNDNYQQDYTSPDANSQNHDAELNRVPQQKDNFLTDSNRSVTDQSFAESAGRRTIYPSKSWVSGNQSKDTGSSFPQRSAGPKQGRLLARKGLWLPRAKNEAQRQFFQATENREESRVSSKKSANLTPVVARTTETETISTLDDRSKEADHTLDEFGSDTIKAGKFGTVNRCNKVGDIDRQSENTEIERDNLTAVENSSNEAGQVSTQFESGTDKAENIAPIICPPNEAGNISGLLGSGSIEAENITPRSPFNEAKNTSRPFGSGSIESENITPRSPYNVAKNTSRPFGSGSIEAENIIQIESSSNKTKNPSTPSGSGSIEAENITPRSPLKKARNTSRPFGSGSIEAENIIQIRSPSNKTKNTSTPSGSGLIAAENITPRSPSNEARKTSRPFGSGLIEAENIIQIGSPSNKTKNPSTPSGSGSIEAENITPRSPFKKARNTSRPFGSGSIKAENIIQIRSPSNKTKNTSTPSGSGLIEAENITPRSPFNKARSTSTPFGSGSIEAKNITPRSPSDKARNTSRLFGSGSIEAENIIPIKSPSNRTRNTSRPSGSGSIAAENITPRSPFNEARKTSRPFGSGSIEAENIIQIGSPSNKTKNPSTPSGSGSIEAENITPRSPLKKARNTSRPFGSGSIEAENIIQIRSPSNETKNTSTPSGSGLIEAENITPRSPFNKARNTSTPFGSGSIEAKNITPRSPSDKARNTSRLFGSGSIEAENIIPIKSPSNRTRNTSRPSGSGSIAAENITPRSPFNEARKTSRPFGSGSIEAENITPHVNRSKRGENFATRFRRIVGDIEDFSTPFGSGSIDTGILFTRLGSGLIEAENNTRFVDRSNKAADISTRFVAEPVDVGNTVEDFDAATIFTRFEEGLTNVELTDDIIRRDCSRMIKGLTKKERKLKRLEDKSLKRKKLRTERKNKKKELLKLARTLNNDCLIMDASKYKVVAKKNKVNMRQFEPEPVDISSDSDDSILEVPVPPKTPPPIIQLQDSDDDSERSKKSPSKRRRKPAEESQEESTPSCSPEKHSSNVAETNSPNLQQILRESAKKARNASNIQPQQESEDDNGKSNKSRSKKGKKSMEESREESSENEESSAPQISETSPTNLRKNSRAANTSKAKNYEASSIDPPQECENDGEKSGKSRCKKGKKSAEETRDESALPRNIEPESSQDFEASAAQVREADLQKMLREASKKAKNLETVPVSSPEDNNLILNCTEIQRGATSLEEIRKMRETVTMIHAHSDDSMTESEANNWVNIAAAQGNSSIEDAEICSTDSSDRVHTALWHQLTQENQAATTVPFKESGEASGKVDSPIPNTSQAIEGDTEVSPANSRKRQKDAVPSPFIDFDVPAVPEKRVKNKHKTSREQTMTEYFFKPMSKELQAFYNNPWGGENLDIYDIQSRMPRNPNCWAILDADLQGPTSRKRKSCPRCKSDAHWGKRCPEKAKTPCCFMCGTKGHTDSRCPHTMCLTCGRKYATYRPTCGYCTQLHCTMCNGAGHSCENCPDLWRKYHQTTKETMPIKPANTLNIMKPTQSLSCCNCAKRGHDATTCKQLRWSQHYLTPMYISSYTKGPTYELSNRHRIQDTCSDFTSDVPPNEQFYDTDTNSFTIYDTEASSLPIQNTDVSSLPIHKMSHSENPEEGNPIENIEIIEIPDDIPPLIPLSHTQVLFRVGEWDMRKASCQGWPRVVKRLDTLESIELTGLLSSLAKPLFLIPWQAYFVFGVEIVHNNTSGTFVTIQCPTKAIFKELESVVWQWLSRRDSEKPYLAYDKIPYENNGAVNQDMRMKLVQIRSVLQPHELLKKIASSDKTLRNTSSNLKQAQTKKNKRRLSALLSTCETSSSRRCQLVTSLYSGNWVEGGQPIVNRFRSLARERLRLFNMGQTLPTREYLQLVFAYNELFAFHETEALKKALEKAVAAMLNDGCQSTKESQNCNDFAYPSAEINVIQKNVMENSNFAPSVGKTLTNEAGEYLEESHQSLANSASNCGFNAPQSSAGSQVLNPYCSQVSDQAPTVNDEVRTMLPQLKKKRKTVKSGLLQDLTKKRRKLYRRSLEDAIKVASASDVPRLRQMANIVKKKMDFLTLRTTEIDKLQNAIRADLGTGNGIGITKDAKTGLKPFKGTRRTRGRRQEEETSETNVQFLRTL